MKHINEMNAKKIYIYKIAEFLSTNDKKMSGEELADHLNRNNFMTSYGTEYAGGRGTYKLIEETYKWLENELELPIEAGKIATAFVKPDGKFAWEK